MKKSQSKTLDIHKVPRLSAHAKDILKKYETFKAMEMIDRESVFSQIHSITKPLLIKGTFYCPNVFPALTEYLVLFGQGLIIEKSILKKIDNKASWVDHFGKHYGPQNLSLARKCMRIVRAKDAIKYYYLGFNLLHTIVVKIGKNPSGECPIGYFLWKKGLIVNLTNFGWAVGSIKMIYKNLSLLYNDYVDDDSEEQMLKIIEEIDFRNTIRI
jgi:hypothetical protein